MSKEPRYFVKAADVAAYSPKNHTGTVNRRLIAPETVGARQLEVLLGVVEKSHGALPHSHPGIEQVCYVLKGRAVAEVDGQRAELEAGDACFFPADMPHTFMAVSDDPVHVLVIYAPPYLETHAVAHASA